jgi:hypothetical protein
MLESLALLKVMETSFQADEPEGQI